MGKILDVIEATCLIFILYYFSGINSEQKCWFHFSSFVFKLIISCFRSNEDRHGSLSKNLAHFVTTVCKAFIQYNENSELYTKDLYNLLSFVLTTAQDIFFIFDKEKKQQLQRQKQEEHNV
ncbi:hypothetical protein DDB_G0267790 [Dictyostelium discoideum AX4]|uniref:Uncharacterized protein n=1 Tax=Dictyostelium discoideum TaxID=44689 RepID=Q55G73_DICDI|nr:hypothetical protein DDB_G0267790 [Dictyostelium discoideum AX4]EAL73348.1 hypothetical protein DDB_G0267790 [Dictyostelium discoideum AX4]|eukprot:XP_647310.1 hypothetical protein DDB_G0267790 [Dictyostelium discoideum AX4]